jgi:predicted nucleic acid-binding protein
MSGSASRTALIVDSTVLSNFARINRTELLQLGLDDRGKITPQILSEILRGESLGRIPQSDWTWLAIVELMDEEISLFIELSPKLGQGEANCLAIASSRSAIIVTDDQAARQLARKIGVSVSGTLSMLQTLELSGHLSVDEADTLLGEMIQQGYRSPVQSLKELPR